MYDTAKRHLLGAAIAVACLGGAAGASAAISAQEASRALRQGVKIEASAARTGIKQAARDALAEIRSLTSEVPSGSFDLVDLVALDGTLMELEHDLTSQVLSFALGSATLTSELLDELAGGGTPMGIFPDGFYQGDAGPFDAAYGAIDEEIDKAVAKVEKKLGVLAERLAAEAGVGLTFDLRMPFRKLEYHVNHGGSNAAMASQLFLAYAYAYSELGVADDGRLCVGGTAPNTSTTLEIEAAGGYGAATVTATTIGQSTTPAWHHCLSGLQEGNYLLEVRRQGDAASHSIGLGVR